MASTKTILGKYIERLDNRNIELKYGLDDVCGVSNNKELMPTKADISDRDLSKFRIIYPGDFVYNHRTSRHGGKFCISYNSFNKPMICTEDYTVFRIKDEAKSKLSNVWLYMFFNRPEFDRFVMFSSWGSSTEFFNWEDVQNIEIEIPTIEIQNKYESVYLSMILNQHSYEQGLDDLKLTCDAYIEELRRKMPCEKIGKYLDEVSVKNIENKYGIESIRGISIKKEFTETKADTNDLSTTNYKIVTKDQFAFNPNTARMGEKICVAYNNSENNYLVSAIYSVFEINQKDKLCAEYLMMFFLRSEFDRYVRFNSWGSARETFDFPDMCEVQIPIPSINIQHSIVDVFKVYSERKQINEKLKSQIKDICPILIKGSLEA